MYRIKFKDGSEKEYETLVNAYLRNANLRGADLENTYVYSFTLGKHFGFYHEGYVKIGCKGYRLDYWLEHVEEIGEANGYTQNEIFRYKAQLTALKLIEKRERKCK